MAAKMNGVWKIKSSDNFDEYMKAIGVGLAVRILGNLAKPVLTVKIEGGKLSMTSESSFRNLQFDCTIGQEFDEETPDGRKCKTTYKWDDEKLIQTQKWDGKTSTITRFMDGDNLSMELVMGDVVSTRVYERK